MHLGNSARKSVKFSSALKGFIELAMNGQSQYNIRVSMEDGNCKWIRNVDLTKLKFACGVSPGSIVEIILQRSRHFGETGTVVSWRPGKKKWKVRFADGTNGVYRPYWIKWCNVVTPRGEKSVSKRKGTHSGRQLARKKLKT